MGSWGTNAPGKRRTREHVIADLSGNHIERFALRCGWTVQRTTHDYGIDLTMKTYDSAGEPEHGIVSFQMKATDNARWRKNGKAVAVRLEWRDIQAWRGEPMPVILVLYDAADDKAYWLHVQSYFGGQRRRPPKNAGVTTTAYLQCDDIVSEAAIRRFGGFRDAVMAQFRKVRLYEE